ncbi:MAG: sigma 54-interacting transcriptional regulator [Deltaproteobacteria bacterium]|nr:sigma 54-interacting transcriptional regulator [Deltaproteobacteria bacterium]
MPWSSSRKYLSFLRINNAILSQYTREGLFRALAVELKKLFPYDRCSIHLYDRKSNSLSYFATAEGIKPDGISCESSRPLPKGSVARMVIESRRPVIIKDLSKSEQLTTAESMWKEGLKSTLAFPLIIREKILGSLHFSFKACPQNLDELCGFIEELSVQITIAIDNMLSYDKLRLINEKLEKEKRYVLERQDRLSQKFYYNSGVMVDLMRDVDLVADTDTSVLISGETGTGKDHIARYIHNLSWRKDHLFVKVNCAALVPTLIESELFGHAKGSFTGANNRRIGRFEMADGGTAFLDEIGDLPIQSQAKLLQVLEDRSFERVGESTPISVDFRVIAATNQNLPQKIRDRTFRRDLYYRVNTVHLNIPPLRDRIGDVPLLVRCFTTNFSEKLQKPETRYSSAAIDALCQYPWPGNVRELENLVERLMIHRPGHLITERDINKLLQPLEPTERAYDGGFLTKDEMEKKHIEEALSQCGWVVGGKKGAASLLGIPRSTLQYRMKRLGIQARQIGKATSRSSQGAMGYGLSFG